MKDILNIAKQYYSTDLSYEESVEYKRLVERIVSEQRDRSIELPLTQILTTSFLSPNYIVEDITMFSNLDRCYTFRIEDCKKSNKTHVYDTILCVSILGPYYCIYERKTIIEYDIHGKRAGQLYEIYTQQLGPVSKHIIKVLKDFFTSHHYQQVNGEQLIIPVPHFNICGITAAEFTLFNVLFKDSMEVP